MKEITLFFKDCKTENSNTKGRKPIEENLQRLFFNVRNVGRKKTRGFRLPGMGFLAINFNCSFQPSQRFQAFVSFNIFHRLSEKNSLTVY